MKKRIPLTAAIQVILLLSILTVVLSSCASVQVVQKEGDVLKIIDLVNQGDSETLKALSRVPFLFDGEIIILESDVKILWENVVNAGFKLPSAEVAAITEAAEQDSAVFGGSMETATYFSKYLPETARIADVRSGSMQVLLLLDGKKDGYPQIYGMKVN
jgi:hypothetical protein